MRAPAPHPTYRMAGNEASKAKNSFIMWKAAMGSITPIFTFIMCAKTYRRICKYNLHMMLTLGYNYDAMTTETMKGVKP
jgi:hypothetical protein